MILAVKYLPNSEGRKQFFRGYQFSVLISIKRSITLGLSE